MKRKSFGRILGLGLGLIFITSTAHATDWKVWDFTSGTEVADLTDWVRNGGVTYTQAWDGVSSIAYTLTAGNSDLRSENTPVAPQPAFATYPYITYTLTVSGIPAGSNLRFRPREFVTDSSGTNYGSFLSTVTDLTNGTYVLTVNLTDPANYNANGSPHVFSAANDWLYRTRTIFDVTTIANITQPAVYGALGLKVDKIVVTDTPPVDTTAPTGTLQINTGATTTNTTSATLALSATDNVGGIGVADYRLSNDNITFSAWQPYTTSVPWTLASGDGTKTVYVQYRDASANVSTGTTSASITLRTLWDFVTSAEATAGDWPQSRVPAQWTQTWDNSSSQVWSLVSAPNSDFRSDYVLATPKPFIKDAPYVSYKLTVSGVPSGSNVSFQPREFIPDATGVDAGAYAGQVWKLTNGTYVLTVTLSDPAQYVVNGSNQSLDTNLGVFFKSSTRIDFQPVAGISTPAVYSAIQAAIDYVKFTSTPPSDTTAPTGSLTINSGATATNSTAVTLNLSATDSGIGVADYRVSENSSFPGSGTAGTDSIWKPYAASVPFTLSSGDGAKTVYVQYRDASANVTTGTISAGITLDTVAPVPVLSTTAGDPVVGGITVNVDTGESTTTLDASAFTSNFATVTGFTGSGSTYSFTLVPTIPGVFSVSLGAGKYTDAAGNPNVAAPASISRTYDPTVPAATVITPATIGPTNTTSVNFAVTFSKSVVNFNNAADVVITHSGTANTGLSISGSGASYTVSVTGISGNGSFTLAVSTSSDVNDSLNNPLASSITSVPVVIDNTSPNFNSIVATPNQASDGQQISITFSSNDNILSDPDVTVNGHPATRSAKSLSTFTYTYTVQPVDPLGPATIQIQGLDTAGNAGSGSTTSAFTVIAEVVPVPALGGAGLAALGTALAAAGTWKRKRR